MDTARWSADVEVDQRYGRPSSVKRLVVGSRLRPGLESGWTSEIKSRAERYKAVSRALGEEVTWDDDEGHVGGLGVLSTVFRSASTCPRWKRW